VTAADYVGIAGLITSTGAVITSIIVAIRQSETHYKLDAVSKQVETSNGETLGEIVEANDLRPGHPLNPAPPVP